MDITVNPIFQQMNDYVSNYTVGNIDDSNRLRAINRAIEDLHRTLGLTCDEQIFNFLYSQDNMFTDLPTDFDEPILLYYDKKENNFGGQAGWQWNLYTRILQNTGNARSTYQKLFSSTNINGKKQLIQLGSNIIQGGVINPFNTLNLIMGTGDTTNLAVDNNIWKNTGGSISFTIDPTLGNGYAGIKVSGFGIMSVAQAIKESGIFKVWSYLQSIDLASIDLILTSATGSYRFSATTQDDSLPFIIDEWNRTQYQWSLVSITGSPDASAITEYEFQYIESPTFGILPIDYFRIDDFYLVYPDEMNLVYYSQYKGTDATGTIKKIILDDLSDLPTFMQFYPDFLNMVALRAAYILLPQLSGDTQFMELYRRDYIEAIKDLGKIYPRKRCVNLGQTQLRRP